MNCKLILTFLVVVGIMPCHAASSDDSLQTVEQRYPNLASSVLTYAAVGTLPGGILLKSGDIEIRSTDLDKSISQQPEQIQTELKKNTFFVLEQEAAGKLLKKIAVQTLSESGKDVSSITDNQLLQTFFETLTKDIAATEDEQRAFFKSNPQFFRGAPFENVQLQIAQHLTQEKRQHFVEDYIRTIGQKMTVMVSDEWTRQQAELAKDNPLDKARQSGKHTVVVFNATTPCCPDKIGPVVAAIGKQFGSRLNTVSLNPNTEPILAARYQVRGNPYLIFYGADGKEGFRQQGDMSKDDILAKLSEIGLE